MKEIVANELAKDGGKQVWINANCTVLSSSPTAKESAYEVKIGQRVYMQGAYYTVEKAANNNLHLAPE